LWTASFSRRPLKRRTAGYGKNGVLKIPDQVKMKQCNPANKIRF
jgi:hypothetical protein